MGAHELSFKEDNHAASSAREATTVASTARCSSKIWGLTRMVHNATSFARAAAICFSAAKCSLRSWLYCVHHGLGRRLFGGGVGDFGGRCRAGSWGMWNVEGGG